MKIQNMVIAIDFDGTIVDHNYPLIGRPVPHAIETMKRLIKEKHLLILYTMRSGKNLDAAVDYCEENGIQFWGVNNNPDQSEWTNSPKVYADKYIDDAAVGMPLRDYPDFLNPAVCWDYVSNYFFNSSNV